MEFASFVEGHNSLLVSQGRSVDFAMVLSRGLTMTASQYVRPKLHATTRSTKRNARYACLQLMRICSPFKNCSATILENVLIVRTTYWMRRNESLHNTSSLKK